MAWGDPQDYWWLRREGSSSPAPMMQFGAQLRQQAIANALKQKDQELETQRTGIQLQEYFSKKELQNKILAGNMKLAKTLSATNAPASDDFARNLWGILEEQPELGDTPQFKQALQFHETAKKARLQRELIDAAGYVQPDESTGAPGYFLDAKGGVRFAPQPRVTQGAPTWVPENKETGMPAHFETSGGRVQFPPRTLPDGSTFQPEEKVIGGTRLIHTSPNRWQVVETTISGKLTDVERETIRDLRAQRNAIATKLAKYQVPAITATEKADPVTYKKQKAQVNEYEADLLKMAEFSAKMDALTKKAESRSGSTAPLSPAGTPLDTKLKGGWKIEPVK